MITLEEVKDYFESHYHNHKRGTGININKNLWLDYQEFCLRLSRKTNKHKVTPSSRIRLLMVRDMMENKQI